MGILSILASRNYGIYSKELANIIGLEEAVIIGELASEYDYWEKSKQLEDDYFYSTCENIQKNTALNEYEQRKALKRLQDLQIIEIKRKGVPARRYFKINEEQLLKILNIKTFKNSSSSSLKFKGLDVENLKTNNNNINNNKNNNKENIVKEKFIPPTLEEIQQYAEERNSEVDPITFYEYFTEGNWKDSKGNKVKNWKQKFITWEKHTTISQTTPKKRILDKPWWMDATQEELKSGITEAEWKKKHNVL